MGRERTTEREGWEKRNKERGEREREKEGERGGERAREFALFEGNCMLHIPRWGVGLKSSTVKMQSCIPNTLVPAGLASILPESYHAHHAGVASHDTALPFHTVVVSGVLWHS